MNQVLQDYATMMLQGAEISLRAATAPPEEARIRLETAIETLRHLVNTPSSDDLHDLKIRTACRVVYLNLMD